MRYCASVLLAAVSLCLVACGGGGNGSGGGTSPTPPPVTNSAPRLTVGAFNGTEDTDLAGSVQATDPDGDAVTFAKTSDPAHGQLVRFETTGAFTYRPTGDYAGTDSFTVRMSDPANNQATATVTIVLAAVNDAPRGLATNIVATEDQPASGQVAASDPEQDAVTFERIGNGTKGVVIVISADGTFSYAPNQNATGEDSFQIRARDAQGAETLLTVNVSIRPQNDPPTIQDDVVTVTATNPTVDVLANDADPDGDALTLTLTGTPVYGQTSAVNGRVQLTLPPNFRGFTRFTYRAEDSAGLGRDATAVVFVDAQPVRVLYESNEATGTMHLYVDDLIAPRQISNFSSPSYNGFVKVAANGSNVLFEEAISGVNNSYVTLNAWVQPIDGSRPARRINAPLQGGETLNVRSILSPDGSWVAYGITNAGGEETLYLADLRANGTAAEIAKPPGARRIDSEFLGITFGPTSQYFYYNAIFRFGAAEGSATYRASVVDPSLPPLRLSAPAAANRFAAIRHVSPTEDYVVETSTGLQAYRALERVDVANAGAPVALSPTLATGELITGGTVADPALDRVAYFVQRATTPVEYGLHVADVGQAGSGMLVSDVASYIVPPLLISMHPGGNAALLELGASGPNSALLFQLSETALSAGAVRQVITPDRQGLPIYDYIPDSASTPANAISYPANGVVSVPRGSPGNVTTHFALPTPKHVWAPDYSMLAAIVLEGGGPHLYLVNRTHNAPMRITGNDDPASTTLDFFIVPRN